MAKHRGQYRGYKEMTADDREALFKLIILGDGSKTNGELEQILDCDFNWLIDARIHLKRNKGIGPIKWIGTGGDD